MLCAGCKQVFDRPVTLNEDGTWISRAEWIVPLAVIKGSSLSCVACHTMGSLPYVNYRAYDGGGEIYWWGSITLLIEQVKDKGSLDLIARPESTSTNSPDTFAFIRECMQKCQANHRICRAAATQQPWYPTRLIQVEDSGARLIITRDTPPQGSYATLSHCWGGRLDVTQCTSNNLGELKNGIELTSLPANFRDAIHAIRALGIAYIWIDSLCIVQDSHTDKIIEIKTMLNVFRQSVLNLAATRAVDSHAGLFAPRSPENLSAGPFRISNGVFNGMFVTVEAAADGGYWADVIDGAPLSLRGWVLQERLLSPRIVHFTDDQVIWDCAESTAAEFVPLGARSVQILTPGYIGPKCSSGILPMSPGKGEALMLWSRVADSYSQCQLSRASDKLLALSGVADSLRSILGADDGEGGYYVGLWRFQMELQLCWRTDRHREGPLPTRRNQLAPSWSWMSVDGPVTTYVLRRYHSCGSELEMLSQVAGVDTEEPEANDGRQHGRLRLRCILNAVELETEPVLTPRVAAIKMNAAVRLDSADAADIAGPLFFVPVFDLYGPDERRLRPYPPAHMRGLLLELVGDEVTGVYSRRGFVLTGATEDLRFGGDIEDSYLSMLSAVVSLG